MIENKLLLYGAGGHCHSIIDSIDRKQYSDIVIIDLPDKVGENIYSIPVTGTDEDLGDYYKKGYRQAVVALGSIGNPEKRVKTYQKLKGYGFTFPIIKDPTAIIPTSNIDIGEGVFIGKGVIINTGVRIGICTIINSGVIIDHDCIIDQFVHIAPGVNMSGGIHICDNVHVGVGSSIIQSITIGTNTIIGAGSVVISDITENVTAFGIPCKVKK